MITSKQLVRRGKESARKLTRARALQFLHQGQHPQQISDTLGISLATLFNLKKRYRHNLNTHKYGSFYEHLPLERARQLSRKLVFHFTSKHGSWLNMAEPGGRSH